MTCPLGIQNCISCDSNEVHTDRESLESEANILLSATEKTVFALATRAFIKHALEVLEDRERDVRVLTEDLDDMREARNRAEDALQRERDSHYGTRQLAVELRRDFKAAYDRADAADATVRELREKLRAIGAAASSSTPARLEDVLSKNHAEDNKHSAEWRLITELRDVRGVLMPAHADFLLTHMDLVRKGPTVVEAYSLFHGRHIQAIKDIRDRLHCGIGDAKALMEYFRATLTLDWSEGRKTHPSWSGTFIVCLECTTIDACMERVVNMFGADASRYELVRDLLNRG